MAEFQEKVQDLLNMGVGLMAEAKYEETKKLMKSALELEPENYDAYIHLGNAHANLGEYDDAIKAFGNALIVRPQSGEALMSTANVYYLKDEYHKAIKFYNKTEEVGAQTADMYVVMADIFNKAEDPEQTLRCFNRALKLAPLRGDIWRNKILLLIESDNMDVADEALDEFTELLPDAFDAYELQTKLCLRIGNLAKAKTVVEKATARFPEDPRIRLIELNFYVESGDTEKAKALINEFKQKGWSEGMRKNIALQESRLMLEDGRLAELPAELEWAIEENPNDSELLFLLLNTYTSMLNSEKSLSTADRLIALNDVPASILAHAKFYRASFLKQLGREDEAKADFKKLTKEFRKMTINEPGLFDVYMYRLMCHIEIEEYDQALELADYLESVTPDSGEGHAFKHVIYKKMGNEAKAREELEEARKLNPTIKEYTMK